jgi:16S rRNA (uracil1498-N3)-methyltransferase
MRSEEEFMAARLFVEADLRRGVEIKLSGAQGHYLRNVLRLKAGISVALFNGRHGEWRARIIEAGKKETTVSVQDQTRYQNAVPDIWLVFALLKQSHLNFIVEKATELGVSVLQPIFTQITDIGRTNVERLRAHAIEAAEQSERLSVPAIREALNLHGVLAQWPSERRILACVEAGTAKPIAEVLSAAKQEPPSNHGAWAILVGPAGGFTRSELDALHKLPFVTPVGLGPRILRADTAALAALACWQAILGDGQQRPPHRSFA